MSEQTMSDKQNRSAGQTLPAPTLLGDVWILEEGKYYSDRGLVVCAAKTKTAMVRWIKANYPTHKRNRRQSDGLEIYFECDKEQIWLRCERNDKCPLVA